ncbi:MAG TPA: hypothetical protein PLE19_14390 [Planctomycetota bacterium]|nr:hypothetical protein [Planctomycetota bacterium]
MTKTAHIVLRLAALGSSALVLAACQRVPGAPRDAKPVFYPLPPDPPRIQFLTSINTAWDVVPERVGLAGFLLGPRDPGARNKALVKPYGIAVWNERIYVCDQRGGDVEVFDLARGEHRSLSGTRGLMKSPTNMCVDSEGYKFIVESMRGVIHAFDPQDAHVASFKLQEGRPGGIAAVGNELFVTDVTGDRILVLDRSTGQVRRTFGSKGNEPGQFIMPNAIAADAAGNLYVSDQMNFRLQKLDREGKPLLVTGKAGDAYGTFARPRGVAVGPDGTIYVVESVFEIVQMFNQEGKVLMGFGNYHGAPGFLELPAGVAMDTSCLKHFARYVDPRFEPEYLVFVASQVGAARIGIYAFGHLKQGAEIPALSIPKAAPKPAEAPQPAPKPPEGPQPAPKPEPPAPPSNRP